MRIIQQPNQFGFTKNQMKFVLETSNLNTGAPINQGRRHLLNYQWVANNHFRIDIHFSNGDPLRFRFDVTAAPIVAGYAVGIFNIGQSTATNANTLINQLNQNPALQSYLQISRVIIGTSTYIFLEPKSSNILSVDLGYSGAQTQDEFIDQAITARRSSFKVVGKLMVEKFPKLGTPQFQEACDLSSTVDDQSRVEFDVSKTLDEILQNRIELSFREDLFERLNPDGVAAVLMSNYFVNYFIHFYESWVDEDGNLITTNHIITPTKSALFNGISGEDLLEQDFLQSVGTDGFVFSWWPRERVITPNQPDILVVFYKFGPPVHRMYIERLYTDFTTDQTFFLTGANFSPGPVSYKSGIANLSPIEAQKAPNKIIRSYKLWLATTTGVRISEVVTYHVDYKHYEKEYSYAFINTFGVPQIVSFLGEKGHASKMERKMVKRAVAWSGRAYQFADAQQSHIASDIIRARTGNQMSLSEVKALRDFFFSDFTAEIKGEKVIPITIMSNEMPEYNDQQSIIPVEFEYAPALKQLTSGTDSNGLLSSLMPKNRSVCLLSTPAFSLELLTIEIQDSYDSTLNGLLSDASIEWRLTLMRPNPVTVQLDANTYQAVVSAGDIAKLAAVGLTMPFELTQYAFLIEALSKNPDALNRFAFPILIEARVRQNTLPSEIPDAWSLPAQSIIDVIEVPAWYASVVKLQHWNGLTFGLSRSPGSCVFYVDDLGRRVTIAGSLTTLGSTVSILNGTDARFTRIDSIVVDKAAPLVNGFPVLYIICRESNRLFKLERNRKSSDQESSNWDVTPIFEFPSSDLRRSIDIHPFVRSATGAPLFFFSEYNVASNWSRITALYSVPLLGNFTSVIANNAMLVGQIDGVSPASALSKVVDIKFDNTARLIISEYGHNSKTAIIRILSYEGNNTIAQRVDAANYTLFTLVGANTASDPLAGTTGLNNRPTSSSTPMTLGPVRNARLHDGAAGQIAIHNDAIYMAASTGHCILKLYQIDNGEAITNRDNWRIENYSGGNTAPGHFYELNSYTRYNDPSGLATDGRSFWVGQFENGAIARIDILSGRVRLFSGEQNKTVQQDTKYR
jgi:hypothetical protein